MYVVQCIHNPSMAGLNGGFLWQWKNIWKKITKNGYVCTAWLYHAGIHVLISLGKNKDLFDVWINQNNEQTNWNITKIDQISKLFTY